MTGRAGGAVSQKPRNLLKRKREPDDSVPDSQDDKNDTQMGDEGAATLVKEVLPCSTNLGMRDRHPQPREEDVARLNHWPRGQDALFSFALDSAARLRQQQFKGVLLPDYCEEVVCALHAVVCILAEGHTRAFCLLNRQCLAHSVQEEEGWQTPPCWRRLTANFLFDDTLSAMWLRFGPPNGWKATVHTIRRWLHNDEGRRLLTMDLENN